MKAKKILDFIVNKSPPLGEEEGFRFGNKDIDVTGILVCWMATVDAIRKAGAENCNLMVVHEDLFFPSAHYKYPLEPYLSGPVNSRRIELLSRHKITVIRAHWTLDRIFILDDLAARLGLPEPTVEEGYYRVYNIKPVKISDLAQRIKKRMNLTSVRVIGAPQKIVKRIGLPWGGLGLSANANFVHRLLEYNVDCLIAGETDEYVMHAVSDAGVSLIETSHVESENPGLEHFADVLSKSFPEIKTVFFKIPRVWNSI